MTQLGQRVLPQIWTIGGGLLVAVGLLTGLVACSESEPASGYAQEVLQSRVERDMEMREKDSVLPVTARASFQGLNYYPVDSTYRFVVSVRRFARPDTVMMPESTGGIMEQVKIGHVTLAFPPDSATADSVRLTVFEFQRGDARGDLWIPFTDATNGDQTYDAGRYVDLGDAPGDSVVVDFNRAYNPTCAYNPRFACPIPPPENRVGAPVPVGEKKPRFRSG